MNHSFNKDQLKIRIRSKVLEFEPNISDLKNLAICILRKLLCTIDNHILTKIDYDHL